MYLRPRVQRATVRGTLKKVLFCERRRGRGRGGVIFEMVANMVNQVVMCGSMTRKFKVNTVLWGCGVTFSG